MDEYQNMKICQRQFHVVKNTNEIGGTQVILMGIEDFAVEELCEINTMIANYISHVSQERQSILQDLKEIIYEH